MEDIIVITGPTGVGKTKLSIKLAKKINAEIINADSVAVYKELNIGSAKPTKEEQSIIKHHLIDICEVTDDYSVYQYQIDCRNKIKEIQDKNKRVIIVGGTGLYIKAALYNYEFIENTNYNDYKDLSNEEIKNKLLKYDKNIDIHINNRQRLVSTLNKYENSDQISNKKDELLYPCKIIGLTTDRENLYNRINNRVDIMINNGLIDEVNNLKDKYNKSRVLNSAIGYKEFYEYLFDNKSIEEVIEQIKKDSRRYAKRQYTFFNNQFKTNWFEVDFNNFNNTIKEVYKYIK